MNYSMVVKNEEFLSHLNRSHAIYENAEKLAGYLTFLRLGFFPGKM